MDEVPRFCVLVSSRRQRPKSPKTIALLIGCAAIFLLASPPAEAALPDDLQEAVGTVLRESLEKANRVFGVDVQGTASIYHVPGLSDSPRFTDDFVASVAELLEDEHAMVVLSANDLSARLESIYMDVSDLRDGDKRAAFSRTPQARELEWMFLLSHELRGDEVFLYVRVEQVSPVGGSTRAEERIAKSESILRYLGEPVPRTLLVDAPDGARVYVDGDYLGIAKDQPLSARLLAGRHEVKVALSGYASYERSVRMSDQQDLRLKIDKRNNSGVPVKSFLLGALLPGMAARVYGGAITEAGTQESPSKSFADVSAGLFYIAAGVWAFDHFGSPDYLTRGSEDRDEKIEKVELGICVATYVLNIVGSIWVGNDYAAKNRELVLHSETPVTAQEGSVRGSLGLAWLHGPDGPAPALSFSASF